MRLSVGGVGLWARGLTSYDAFERAVLRGEVDVVGAAFVPPRPASIPPRERRRAGLLINLAVEVAHQACDHANVDKSLMASVFASSMGDTAITDYMCRKLAGTDRLLSPAKFTNSVHNAGSGHWSISAGSRAPSTFVGGFDASFGVGLLEAVSQATAFDEPVLLVACDIANAQPLAGIRDIRESLAVALVVEAGVSTSGDRAGLLETELRFVPEPAERPMPRTKGLDELAQANPMGAALVLLERCVGTGIADTPLRIPAAARGCVELFF